MSFKLVSFSISLKAEKKGASNTVTGMIFGCYALFELLASLLFGKYVSITVHMDILILKNHIMIYCNLLVESPLIRKPLLFMNCATVTVPFLGLIGQLVDF